MNNFNISQIDEAYQRIQPFIVKTPLIYSEYLNNITRAKVFFKLENLGANFCIIKSRKKRLTNKYNSTAPIVVAISEISIPHHFPKTNPAKIKSGLAKPKNNTQIIEKIKKAIDKNKKFSLLYFKIISLFDLINS